MPSFDHLIECEIAETMRTTKLRAVFDIPSKPKTTSSWHVDLPIEDKEWHVGLIVGPSGSGKTQIMTRLWGGMSALEWPANKAVIDAFPLGMTAEEVCSICSAVGFNTMPAWLRPFRALSNGEQFRVDLARRLAETDPGSVTVVDEFSSVVDRQVGKIASHAVQKHVRRSGAQFVAVSCHYDIIDWLQPDWIYEPASNTLTWRSLQRRPELQLEICRVGFENWHIFSPYHYLTAELSKSARCYAALVDGRPVSIIGVIHRPYGKEKGFSPIFGVSRGVTLPDWQGLGIVYVLMMTIGAAHKAMGHRLRIYPAHFAAMRAVKKHPVWKMIRKPGIGSALKRRRRRRDVPSCETVRNTGRMLGLRPCAVYEYVGDPIGRDEAISLLG